MTNPWLAEPKPEAVLPRDALEDRIQHLLSTQNMAVVATVPRTGRRPPRRSGTTASAWR